MPTLFHFAPAISLCLMVSRRWCRFDDLTPLLSSIVVFLPLSLMLIFSHYLIIVAFLSLFFIDDWCFRHFCFRHALIDAIIFIFIFASDMIDCRWFYDAILLMYFILMLMLMLSLFSMLSFRFWFSLFDFLTYLISSPCATLIDDAFADYAYYALIAISIAFFLYFRYFFISYAIFFAMPPPFIFFLADFRHADTSALIIFFIFLIISLSPFDASLRFIFFRYFILMPFSSSLMMLMLFSSLSCALYYFFFSLSFLSFSACPFPTADAAYFPHFHDMPAALCRCWWCRWYFDDIFAFSASIIFAMPFLSLTLIDFDFLRHCFLFFFDFTLFRLMMLMMLFISADFFFFFDFAADFRLFSDFSDYLRLAAISRRRDFTRFSPFRLWFLFDWCHFFRRCFLFRFLIFLHFALSFSFISFAYRDFIFLLPLFSIIAFFFISFSSLFIFIFSFAAALFSMISFRHWLLIIFIIFADAADAITFMLRWFSRHHFLRRFHFDAPLSHFADADLFFASSLTMPGAMLIIDYADILLFLMPLRRTRQRHAIIFISFWFCHAAAMITLLLFISFFSFSSSWFLLFILFSPCCFRFLFRFLRFRHISLDAFDFAACLFHFLLFLRLILFLWCCCRFRLRFRDLIFADTRFAAAWFCFHYFLIISCCFDYFDAADFFFASSAVSLPWLPPCWLFLHALPIFDIFAIDDTLLITLCYFRFFMMLLITLRWWLRRERASRDAMSFQYLLRAALPCRLFSLSSDARMHSLPLPRYARAPMPRYADVWRFSDFFMPRDAVMMRSMPMRATLMPRASARLRDVVAAERHTRCAWYFDWSRYAKTYAFRRATRFSLQRLRDIWFMMFFFFCVFDVYAFCLAPPPMPMPCRRATWCCVTRHIFAAAASSCHARAIDEIMILIFFCWCLLLRFDADYLFLIFDWYVLFSLSTFLSFFLMLSIISSPFLSDYLMLFIISFDAIDDDIFAFADYFAIAYWYAMLSRFDYALCLPAMRRAMLYAAALMLPCFRHACFRYIIAICCFSADFACCWLFDAAFRWFFDVVVVCHDYWWLFLFSIFLFCRFRHFRHWCFSFDCFYYFFIVFFRDDADWFFLRHASCHWCHFILIICRIIFFHFWLFHDAMLTFSPPAILLIIFIDIFAFVISIFWFSFIAAFHFLDAAFIFDAMMLFRQLPPFDVYWFRCFIFRLLSFIFDADADSFRFRHWCFRFRFI